jgi:hypothetical protein
MPGTGMARSIRAAGSRVDTTFEDLHRFSPAPDRAGETVRRRGERHRGHEGRKVDRHEPGGLAECRQADRDVPGPLLASRHSRLLRHGADYLWAWRQRQRHGLRIRPRS